MFLQVGRDVPSPSISPQWAQRWKGLSTLKEHLLSYDLLQGSQPCCPHEEQGKSSTPFLGPDGEEPPGARGVRSRWSGQDAFMDKPPQGRAMLRCAGLLPCRHDSKTGRGKRRRKADAPAQAGWGLSRPCCPCSARLFCHSVGERASRDTPARGDTGGPHHRQKFWGQQG